MMISNKDYNEAYVWIWLPMEVQPVVAGKLTTENNKLLFNYGKSYLARKDSIPIYDTELPLRSGFLPLLSGLSIPNCIRDAAPDAWGRRVIINKRLGLKGRDIDSTQLNELTYMLESGSDRIGALDFQHSPTEYIPRASSNATLTELLESAERVEKGIQLTTELDQALHHGSSIGGARPKALIEDNNKKYIAKFSSSSDLYSIIKSEFIAMRLAALSGINVAPVKLTKASNKDILLIERFDRIASSQGWKRRSMVSALTILGLDEMMARYASYENLAEIIRAKFTDAPSTLKELFSRLVFNILSGNTDDHARNHAAFWDGNMLTLTPAYDICPQNRTGNEATQAMLIKGNNNFSRMETCIEAAGIFLLSTEEAISIIEHQKSTITQHWDEICDAAELTQIDKKLLWNRQFLNPYSVK